MDDIKKRLIGCFQIVFPDLPESDIPLLSQTTAASWDSVAAITLLNVLEDEFAIEMDLDQVAELDSFDKVYTYLEKRLQAA
jgi:acyl carrier protein